MKVKDTLYFHSDKSEMRYQFSTLCEKYGVEPTEKALENSVYAGYEVGVDVEWDLETGDCKVLGTAKET
jgi:hypothetical protein